MERFNGEILRTIADALLKPLIPDMQQICAYEMELPRDLQNPLFLHFLSTLIRGKELVKKYESISPFNSFLRYRYGAQIVKLVNDIDVFFRSSAPAHIVMGYIRVISVLKNLLEESDCSIMFQQQITGYIARLCEEYLDSGPTYFDRRRNYFAVKDAYLDMRRDYLKSKEYYMSTWPLSEPERNFLSYEAQFLSIEQRYLAVKKDFMALKQDYQMSFEKDFDRMREFFLGSKRDEFTPHFFSHDVFLSFSGKDVRGTLADHLSQSLSKAGLRVFLDSKDLKKGAKIWPSLKRAIEKSAICIPIYSEGYAESTWCLKESAAMLESPRSIIPLFYGVDPTDVRYPLNKRSPYKKSFEKHYGHPDRQAKQEIDRWKSALGEIFSRSGWTVGVTEDCDVAVERIVKDVIDILRSHKI